MPRTRNAYPEEFKDEAVQMVRAGRSAGDVARSLGCSPQSVANWTRTYERDQGIRADGLKTEEREELKRLRREVVRLKQERDLLKRAAAFFAADQS
ncbi:MAG: transposase [Thermoleophilia bacterium]|nr:transposase [Thermoleophilia bacterium]